MEHTQAVKLTEMFRAKGFTALVNSLEPGQDMNIVELIVPTPWEIAASPLLADRPLASWTDEEYEQWLDSTRPDMPEGDEEYIIWCEEQDRKASKVFGMQEVYFTK